MVSKRDRIIELKKYLESLGINVRDGKNKARGNRGIFKVKAGNFGIDIAQNQSVEVVLSTLVHEFAHYIHYQYDKSLKSLEFILDESDENIIEELIQLTVETIPKTSIKPLFETKDRLKQELKTLPKNSIESIIKQKTLKNIQNRISRLNRYYNSPTELFARSIETFFLKPEIFSTKAPELNKKYTNILINNKIPYLTELQKIFFINL